MAKWEVWYFSEELKFAKDHGYKIKVLKGYTFNKESNVFTDYIKCMLLNRIILTKVKSLGLKVYLIIYFIDLVLIWNRL